MSTQTCVDAVAAAPVELEIAPTRAETTGGPGEPGLTGMDEETFAVFYATSFPRLVGQVYAMCGSVTEAQDCVQEAFIRAWNRRRSLDLNQAPQAWVRTVAYRLAVSRWRRAHRSVRPPDRAHPPSRPAEPDVTQIALTRALQSLPAAQRRAIVLHHLCDLSVAEVAAEVRAPTGTVKARLARGRASLALLLSDPSNGVCRRNGPGA